MQTNHTRVVQSSRVRRAARQPVAVTRSNRSAGSRWRAAAVAMGLGCAAASAHAESFFQIEAGIGGSAYQRASDGLWVQNGFEHQLNLTAPAIEAGIAVNVAQWNHFGITLHADYEWLATVHTQSFATPSDANYNTKTQSCNGPCWPLANFMTSGHDYGFAFMVEPHYDFGNGWRIGVTGGPYVHKSPFSVDVTNWVSSPTATPTNLHVENNAGWQIGYVLGLNVSYKNFGLAYRYFANGGHISESSPYPPIWSKTHVLMGTYRANVF